MHKIILLSFTAVFLIFSVSHAEIKTYLKTVKKVVGTTQSADDAKTFAVADAKRAIVEEAGTYIMSYTRVQNGGLEKDEVEAIATGLLTTEVTNVQNLIENGVYVIAVTVKASVNSDTLKSDIDRIRKNEKLMADYAFVQNRLKEQLDANKALGEKAARLELELKSAKDDSQKRLIEKEQADLRENNAKSANMLNAAFYFTQAFDITGKDDATYDDKRKALGYLNKAIELNPQYDEAYFFRGNFYEMVDQTDKAESDYKTAVGLNPANYKAVNALAMIYFGAKNDRDGAFRILSDAINRDPFAKELYQFRSDFYSLAGQYDPAVKDMQTVVKLDQKDAEAYLSLASLYQTKGESQLALDSFNSALAIDPKNRRAYLARGYQYISMDDNVKAVQDFTSAIAINPADDNAYVSRANAYVSLGKDELALKDFAKAIELGKNNSYNYVSRAFYYSDKGKYALALKDYTSALEKDASDSFIYISRAGVYMAMKDYKNALQDYDKAVKLNGDAYSYTSRAAAYEETGDFQRAVEDYTSALKVSPSDEYLFYKRGRAYVTLGSPKLAIADFTSAIELSPKTEYYYYERALQYYDMQEFDAAAADHTKMLEINPVSTSALYNRGWVYLIQSKNDKALEDFNALIELDKKNAEAYMSRARVYESLALNTDISKDSYLKREYRDKADADYSYTIQLNNSDIEAYVGRAVNRYFRMDDKNFVNRIEAEDAKRKFVPVGDESILKDLAMVQKLNKNDIRPYIFRAKYYIILEQYQTALNEYNAVIKLNPDNASLYTDRAEIYDKMKKRDLMCADAEKACKLGSCWQIETYKKYGDCR